MHARKHLLVLALAAPVVAGCITTATTQKETLPATKPVIDAVVARRAILAEKSRLWKDPESIKEAKIGEPYACTVSQLVSNPARFIEAPASCVCVEANARNTYGGYAGLHRNTIEFLEDGTISVRDTGRLGAQHCPSLVPFPELNGRKR